VSISVNQVKDFIYERLGLAEYRACALKANPEWTPETADDAVHCYRDFLWVCWNWNSDHPGQRLAGFSVLADEVWHCHMLRPAQYQRDCAAIFGQGHLLDHYPFEAGQSVVDAQNLARTAYAKAGVDVPSDLDAECVWGVVE
jgi:hypothetical protein